MSKFRDLMMKVRKKEYIYFDPESLTMKSAGETAVVKVMSNTRKWTIEIKYNI